MDICIPENKTAAVKAAVIQLPRQWIRFNLLFP